MQVLIIGSGGREHALAWKVAQNPQVDTIYVAPGNAGTALEHKVQNVNIGITDIPALVAFAQDKAIELTIVGPEAPLVIGVVDAFRAAGLPILAPPKAQRNWKAPKPSLKISSLAITFQQRLTPTSLKLSQLWLMCVKKVRRLS